MPQAMTEERLKELETWAKWAIRDHAGQPLGKSGEGTLELIAEVRRLKALLNLPGKIGLDPEVFR